MSRLAWLLYYVGIYLMVSSIYISAIWNSKSRRWIIGRRNWKLNTANLPPKQGHRIWFHVSSLGEFEQARPVIEQLKKANAATDIILTFFSPSGYELKSGYDKAVVMYLPADLPGHASQWITQIQPDAAVFVKYDLWPGYLKVLQEKSIPSVLISAHWIPGQAFSSWSIPPSRVLLKRMNRIFFQKPDHLEFFRQNGFDNLRHAGDTRIDRSLQLPIEAQDRIPVLLIEAGPFDLVAGSTWPADERFLIRVIDRLKMKVLIAPHDVSESNIRRLIDSLPSPVTRLSELKDSDTKPRVVLVDSIGMLAYLYALGTISYVGGGFGSGIHNILEPMAHQKPVIFGPRYRKFPEAEDMLHIRSAVSIKSESELEAAIRAFQKPGAAQEAGRHAFNYMQSNAGASIVVANYLQELIPFDA